MLGGGGRARRPLGTVTPARARGIREHARAARDSARQCATARGAERGSRETGAHEPHRGSQIATRHIVYHR